MHPPNAAPQQHSVPGVFDAVRVSEPQYVVPPFRPHLAPRPQPQNISHNPQQLAPCGICGFEIAHSLEECPWQAPDLATTICRLLRLQLGPGNYAGNPSFPRLMHIYAGARNGTASVFLDQSGRPVSLTRRLPDASFLDWKLWGPATVVDVVPLPLIPAFEPMLNLLLLRHQQALAQQNQPYLTQVHQTQAQQTQTQQGHTPARNGLAPNLNASSQQASSSKAQQTEIPLGNEPASRTHKNGQQAPSKSTPPARYWAAGLFRPQTPATVSPVAGLWTPVNDQPREQPPLGQPPYVRTSPPPGPGARPSVKHKGRPAQEYRFVNNTGPPPAAGAAAAATPAPPFPLPGQGFRVDKSQSQSKGAAKRAKKAANQSAGTNDSKPQAQQAQQAPPPPTQQQQHQAQAQHPPRPHSRSCKCASCKARVAAISKPQLSATRPLFQPWRPLRPAQPSSTSMPQVMPDRQPQPYNFTPAPSSRAMTNYFLAVRKNYYTVLSIQRHASATEIKAAYRKACLLHHPDRNRGEEAAAEERFKIITEAYAVLGDKERKEEYDRGERIRSARGTGTGAGRGKA